MYQPDFSIWCRKLISQAVKQVRLNHAGALGMPDRFQASVSVELRENVFDVIVHGSRADIQLIGNGPGAVAPCQMF